jgi:hypothetical protein
VIPEKSGSIIMNQNNSAFNPKKLLLHFATYFCIAYIVNVGISCNSLNTKDSTESMLLQVRQYASPYNNVDEVQEKMPDGFFDKMDGDKLVEWIENGFRTNPPGTGINHQRELLFTAMDVAAIAGEKSVRNRGIQDPAYLRAFDLDYSPLVKLRIESERKILKDMKKLAPGKDIVIYKMYNEGVIICAPGICFGVDIVLHPENYHLASDYAKLIDGLFITHNDEDHFNPDSPLNAELRKINKPVILHEPNISVPLGGILTSGKLGNMEWAAFLGGHINLRFSSFYLFRPGDWKILHSGDNCVWLNFASSEYAKNLDLFLLKPESIYVENGRRKGGIQDAMKETLRKINAKVIIPHHLLELGHGLGAYGHDMGFRLFQQAPEGVNVQMLNWGETLKLSK